MSTTTRTTGGSAWNCARRTSFTSPDSTGTTWLRPAGIEFGKSRTIRAGADRRVAFGVIGPFVAISTLMVPSPWTTDTFLTTTGAGVATEELVGVAAGLTLAGAVAADLFAATDWEWLSEQQRSVYSQQSYRAQNEQHTYRAQQLFQPHHVSPHACLLLSRVGGFRRLNKCYRH